MNKTRTSHLINLLIVNTFQVQVSPLWGFIWKTKIKPDLLLLTVERWASSCCPTCFWLVHSTEGLLDAQAADGGELSQDGGQRGDMTQWLRPLLLWPHVLVAATTIICLPAQPLLLLDHLTQEVLGQVVSGRLQLSVLWRFRLLGLRGWRWNVSVVGSWRREQQLETWSLVYKLLAWILL